MGIRRKLISKWYVTSSLVVFVFTSLALYLTKQYCSIFSFDGILSWVYFIWLCYTIFVAIIALFRLLNVYQVGVLIDSKLIFLTYTFFTLLICLNAVFGIYEEKDIKVQYPLLEITVVQYPEKIENSCADYTFKLEVKNIGDVPFTYTSLESGTYSLNLVSSRLTSTIASIKTSSTIENFGEIAPGSKGTITFVPHSTYGKEMRNGFLIFPENRKEELYFQVTTTQKAKINRDVLGSSNSFSLDINSVGVPCSK